MKKLLKLILLCCVLLNAHSIIKAQNNQASYVPGELIVKFKKDNTSAKANHLATKMQAKMLETMPGLELELWKIDQNNAMLNVMDLVEQYKDHPDIEYIEPNYYYSIMDNGTADDPDFIKQWSLNNTGEDIDSNTAVVDADVNALEAWDIQSTSPNIVVGILDTGVDWRHPDLINNIWQNSAEDNDGDGVLKWDTLNGMWVFDERDIDFVDNDDNGYVDDLIGWNFVDDNNQPFDYDAFTAGEYVHSHGTHVAGIIGATGDNGIGISGVTKDVQIAPLKFLTDELKSKGTAWHATKAIHYAVKMGMQISNNSWGGSIATLSTSISNAISRAEDNNHLFVTAAGNGGWDKVGDDIILEGDNISNFYPTSYANNNIISVANTNYADEFNLSSNYSVYQVDIAAPGTSIYSCIPNPAGNVAGSYGVKSGTSMAAPLVAGACALLWEKSDSVFNDVKFEYIKDIVLENADKLPQLKDKVANSGRLNIYKALLALADTDYIDYYNNCRSRDSVALRAVHNAMDLDVNEYAWHTNGSSMDTWNGIRLNNLGCVSKFEINPSVKTEIPDSIGELKDLTLLAISYFPDAIDNNVNITIPQSIFNLTKLKELVLKNSNIAGPIPSEIGQLENLQYLNLADNFLTGNIPGEIWELIKLETLFLFNNQLSGKLSTSVSQLKNLQNLKLSYNQFNDTIPAFNSNLYLNDVDLSYNNFSGKIPKLINSPHVIYNIRLDNNQLSGSLDPLLSWFSKDVEKVYTFNVSNNNLSGCYDPALAKIGRQRLDGEDGIAFPNYYISDGNQFGDTWENFITDDNNSCWASITTKVWPGDTNNDGIVDVDDFMFYESALNNIGPNRNNTVDAINNIGNTSWEGQLCPDWDINLFGVNGKHQDANGDGVVDILDYQVIEDNMGQENPDHKSTNNFTFHSNGIELVFKYDKDTTTTQKTSSGNSKKFIFKLYITEDGGTANLHNLSANIAFNKDIEVDTIEFINDCLNPSETKYLLDSTKTKLGLYYKYQANDDDDCRGALARATIIVEENVPIDGGKFLNFKVEGSINSKDGNTIFETTPTSSYSSLSIDASEDLYVELTTEPERCKDGGSAIVTPFGGQSPYNYVWVNIDDSLYINEDASELKGLVAGNYSLTVTDNNGFVRVILFTIENQLEFDEGGFPLNCETYIETYCPDDLNLTDDIPQDTYNAALYINTDGTIPENTEVELRAAEYIQLSPGFNMEDNTSLRIGIDDCSGDD